MSDRFAEWQAESSKDRASVGVCLDRGLLADLAETKSRLEEAKGESAGMLATPEETKALSARVVELETEIKAKSRTLTFESIGRRRWRKLLAEYPPTPEQVAQFGRVLDHNPETFTPAALVASCVEPGLTSEQARWIVDELPVGVVDRIWAACLKANLTGSRDPFGAGSAEAPPGEKK